MLLILFPDKFRTGDLPDVSGIKPNHQMTKSTNNHGAIGYVSYHAERPFITMPKVVLVNGMYEDKEGKQYIPEMFDRFFKGVKGVVKEKSFKGELIGENFL